MRRKLIHAVNVDRTVFVQRSGPPLEALLCLACTVAGAVMEHLVLVCHPPTLGGSLLLRRALAFRRLRSRSGAGGPFRRLRWCLFNGVGACGRIFFAGVGLIAVFLPAGSRPEAICSAVAAELGVLAVSAGGGLGLKFSSSTEAQGLRPSVLPVQHSRTSSFRRPRTYRLVPALSLQGLGLRMRTHVLWVSHPAVAGAASPLWALQETRAWGSCLAR